jgi:hypothetical protein
MRLARTLGAAVALGAALGLSACSGSGSGGGGGSVATPAPAGSSTSASPAASPGEIPSPSPSPIATLPAARCLSGRYALVRFVAVGAQTYGTGQGGDVSVTFTDGRYTLKGAGRKPVVVTVGGQTGNLTVDGEAKGGYRLKGATATFTDGSATGSGTLDNGSGGDAQKLSMKQVNSVIGLSGDGQVACTAQAMTITLNAIRLELARA